ncbi:hypothetical protein [Uliginosibacterium sp. H1]|uniref:hypothetical protein n=1 Tax=Uliginosibacterium sp. H1 TaxID=3114757 RepID=UPI002E1969A9|nr:hypothetical protein [Uliginosibacterium sp. H1]
MIHARIWRPRAAPRAIVAICQVPGQRAERCAWLAEQLASRRFSVYTLGPAESGEHAVPGLAGMTTHEHVTNMATLLQQAKALEGQLPVYLLGDRPGGAVSSVFALDTFIRGLSHASPQAAPPRRDDDGPAQTMAASTPDQDRWKCQFSHVTLPVPVARGTGTHPGRSRGDDPAEKTAVYGDKTLRLYHGLFRDLLGPHEQGRTLSEVRQWIEERLPLASGSSDEITGRPGMAIPLGGR